MAATVVGALVTLGLFKLAEQTLQLNTETQQLALAEARLIDLQGRWRLAFFSGDSLPPYQSPLCVDPVSGWLQSWCAHTRDVLASVGTDGVTCLSIDGSDLEARLILSDAQCAATDRLFAHHLWSMPL